MARAATARAKKARHRDHVAIAAAFEASVLDGSFPVGKLFLAAVERQRRDLKRAGESRFPYRYDPEVGVRACRFMELLPHVEGPLAGKSVVLEGWQVWAVLTMFAWVNKVTGAPRWRRCTLFMPKGQGKTFLAAGIALYVLATGGKGEKCFSAATATHQARLSFDTARQMLNLAPKVRDHYGLVVEQHRILQPDSGGVYRPVSSEARGLEGIVPSLIVEDEIHCHPDRSVHDNLRSSAAKRPDSRMVVISTAGFDMSPQAIGYEVYCYSRDILQGRVADDSQFCLLIEADRDLDPWAPETWRQGNPNMGVSIDPMEVENEANEARQVPSKQPSFFTKRLGWWVQSAHTWLPLDAWDKCLDESLRLEDFEGRQAYIGLDLAQTRDLTARVLVFPELRSDGQRHYSVFCHAYLPEGSPTLRDGADTLRVWARDGFITLGGGDALDLNLVRDDVIADADKFPGSEMCYDAYFASQIVADLEGVVVPVKIRQGATSQSGPMKELEAAVLTGRLHHDGNPVLRWCVGNVIARVDRNGNSAPDRESESRKIDCAVALINALARAMLGSDSPYQNGEGLKVL